MASPYLNITAVASGQNNKETTINDADIALERATNDILEVNMSAGNVTLTVAQFTRHMVFRATAMPGNRQLTVPNNVGAGVSTAKRVFAVIHDTDGDYDLTITTGAGGGTNVVLKKGMRALISSDGTHLRLVTVAGGDSGISIAAYIPGTVPSSTTMLRYTAATDFTLPAGLVGSFGSLVIGPDGGSVSFDLRLNNVSFGSMDFADGNDQATFSLASDRVVAPGDVISVNSPTDIYDAADLSFTFLGT
jgi:hypothetical protein